MADQPLSPAERKEEVLARVAEGISWYDRNATRTMRLHHALGGVVILAGVLVPIFALTSVAWASYVAAALGAVAAAARGLEAIYKYNEKYMQWRFTANGLKREKYEYEVRIGPYDNKQDDEAIELLATRAEDLTSQEEQHWLALAGPTASDGSSTTS